MSTQSGRYIDKKNVELQDDAGNDITDDVEVDFQDISEAEDSVHINSYTEEEKDTLQLYFYNFISQVDTKVSLSSLPEGYTESEVVLNLVNSDDGNITVTSPNSNVEVIRPENSNVFEIKVTLQKEQQGEPTPQSEDTTESSDDNTQGTEEITEPSDDKTQTAEEITEPSGDETQPEEGNTEPSEDGTQPTEKIKESSDEEKTGVTDEQPTTSEEIKNNDNGGTEAENIVTASVEEAPEAGDKNNSLVWITTAGVAVGVLGTVIAFRRKKKVD